MIIFPSLQNETELQIFCPESYVNSPIALKLQRCNGCGAKFKKIKWLAHLVPNELLGLDIEEVCNVHDWMYFEGVTQNDKNIADEVFYSNMKIRIKNNKSIFLINSVRLLLAKLYYYSVVMFGKSSFHRYDK